MICNYIDAKKLLLNNKILAIPTDTVYGLMAIANGNNEKRINELKESLINKKLSIIFFNVDELEKYIDKNKTYNLDLLERCLPGKYTFIVILNEEFKNKYSFDRYDFGVRVTTNYKLQNLIENTGPLLATSCNKSGDEICNTIEEIKLIYDIDIVEDNIVFDQPSSIIDLTQKEIKIIR